MPKTFTKKEIDTVKKLIIDWGFDYGLIANRDCVIALARKLGMEQVAKSLEV